MTDYKKYTNALRQCAKEHKDDRAFTGEIVVSNLCEAVAELLEEQELILDKVRDKIADVADCDAYTDVQQAFNDGLWEAVKIIDEYKKSEE